MDPIGTKEMLHPPACWVNSGRAPKEWGSAVTKHRLILGTSGRSAIRLTQSLRAKPGADT